MLLEDSLLGLIHTVAQHSYMGLMGNANTDDPA